MPRVDPLDARLRRIVVKARTEELATDEVEELRTALQHERTHAVCYPLLVAARNSGDLSLEPEVATFLSHEDSFVAGFALEVLGYWFRLAEKYVDVIAYFLTVYPDLSEGGYRQLGAVVACRRLSLRDHPAIRSLLIEIANSGLNEIDPTPREAREILAAQKLR